MVTLLNRVRDVLNFNLNDGTTMYVLAKQKFQLTEEQLKSPEIQARLKYQDIIILRMD